jgi:hypothetical protein
VSHVLTVLQSLCVAQRCCCMVNVCAKVVVLVWQTYLASIITTLLFCFSTGQLEAWWSWFDEQACSPPKLDMEMWKYPSCDVGFESSVTHYGEADPEESNSTLEGGIGSINTTCWQDQPVAMPACPFTLNEEFLESTKMSGNQWFHRFASFVVIEHLQVLLLYFVAQWNRNRDGNATSKRKKEMYGLCETVSEFVRVTGLTCLRV